MKRLLILLAMLIAPTAMAQYPTLIPECPAPLPFQCPAENYTCSLSLQLKVCRGNIWYDFQTVTTADQGAGYTWTGKHSWDQGANHVILKSGTFNGIYFDVEDANWIGERPIKMPTAGGSTAARWLGLFAVEPSSLAPNQVLSAATIGDIQGVVAGATPVTWNIASATQCSSAPNGGKLTMSAGGVISCQGDVGGDVGDVDLTASYPWTGDHSWDVAATSSNFCFKDTDGHCLYLDVADITDGSRMRIPAYTDTLMFWAGWTNNPTDGSVVDSQVITSNSEGGLRGLETVGDATEVTWNLISPTACSAATNGGKLTMNAGGVITCEADVSGAVDESANYLWSGNHEWRARNVDYWNDAVTFKVAMDAELLGANVTEMYMAGANGTVYPAFFGDNTDLENNNAGVPFVGNNGKLWVYNAGGTTPLNWSIAATDGCASLANGGKLTIDGSGNISCSADVSGGIDLNANYQWTGTHTFTDFSLVSGNITMPFEIAGTAISPINYKVTMRQGLWSSNSKTELWGAVTLDDPFTGNGTDGTYVGSLPVYGTGGVLTNIVNGNDGEVMTLVGGAPAWAAAAPGGTGLVDCTTPSGLKGIDSDEDGVCEQFFDATTGCIGFDYDDDGAGSESCGGGAAEIVFAATGRQVNLQSESYTVGDALDCPAGGGACTANYSDFPYHAFYSPADVVEIGCWCEGTYSVAPQLTIANATNDGVLGTFTCSTGTNALTYASPDASFDDFTRGQQITLTPNTPTALAGPTTRACQISMAWDVKE